VADAVTSWVHTAVVVLVGLVLLGIVFAIVLMGQWLRDMERRLIRMTRVIATHAASLDRLEDACRGNFRLPSVLRDVAEPAKQGEDLGAV
jgi:hypothetical protein